MTLLKQTITVLSVLIFMIGLAAGCGKKDDKADKVDKAAERAKRTAEICVNEYTKHAKKGADQVKFAEACKTHLKREKNYLACLKTHPNGYQYPYCVKGMKDAAIKAEIDAMMAALGN
jgi:hypothetical protein